MPIWILIVMTVIGGGLCSKECDTIMANWLIHP